MRSHLRNHAHISRSANPVPRGEVFVVLPMEVREHEHDIVHLVKALDRSVAGACKRGTPHLPTFSYEIEDVDDETNFLFANFLHGLLSYKQDGADLRDLTAHSCCTGRKKVHPAGVTLS